MYQKIQYLLTRFKSREWSGPAWYKCINNKHGFPVYWELIHFVAIDLGHGAATEYAGEDLSKAIFKIYSANKKLLKDAYVGMIHSHHNMTAYHSGTDEDTLIDMCPDTGFYGSLVVSSSSTPAAFAFSYKDQFKNIMINEMDSDHIRHTKVTAPKEFVNEANLIKEKADAATPSWKRSSKGKALTEYNPAQSTFDWRYHPNWKKEHQLPPEDDYSDITIKEYEKMETIMEQLEDGSMLYGEANNLFKSNWNMNIHEFYEVPPVTS